MKNIATDLLHFASRLIPTTLLHHWIKRDVISIFYHAVSDEPLDHVSHLYPVVPVAKFKDSLRTLQEHYTFVTYVQLQAHIKGETPLPPDAVHLSFDDGFAECYSVVRPILLEMGIPCTFFLTLDWLDNRILYFRHQISLFVAQMAGLALERQQQVIQGINQHLGLSLGNIEEYRHWITSFRDPNIEILEQVASLLRVDVKAYLDDTQPYLTRTQVRQMHAEGFTIGAHGLTHRKLGFISSQDVEEEILGSCSEVRSITGQQVVPFSFPQSAGNVDRVQLADIRAQHPHIGLLFDTKNLRKDAPFMVNRVWAERPLTPERRLHTLSEILTHAYRDAWVEEVLGRIRPTG